MKNAAPFKVVYAGIEFDPTAYSAKEDFANDVWLEVFSKTERIDWANDSQRRAEILWDRS